MVLTRRGAPTGAPGSPFLASQNCSLRIRGCPVPAWCWAGVTACREALSASLSPSGPVLNIGVPGGGHGPWGASGRTLGPGLVGRSLSGLPLPPWSPAGGEASRHPVAQFRLLHRRLPGAGRAPAAAEPSGDRREDPSGGVQSEPRSIWQRSILPSITTVPNKARPKHTVSPGDLQAAGGKDKELVWDLGHRSNSYSFSISVCEHLQQPLLGVGTPS